MPLSPQVEFNARLIIWQNLDVSNNMNDIKMLRTERVNKRPTFDTHMLLAGRGVATTGDTGTRPPCALPCPPTSK